MHEDSSRVRMFDTFEFFDESFAEGFIEVYSKAKALKVAAKLIKDAHAKKIAEIRETQPRAVRFAEEFVTACYDERQVVQSSGSVLKLSEKDRFWTGIPSDILSGE